MKKIKLFTETESNTNFESIVPGTIVRSDMGAGDEYRLLTKAGHQWSAINMESWVEVDSNSNLSRLCCLQPSKLIEIVGKLEL